jgi:hypothetical protein
MDQLGPRVGVEGARLGVGKLDGMVHGQWAQHTIHSVGDAPALNPAPYGATDAAAPCITPP